MDDFCKDISVSVFEFILVLKYCIIKGTRNGVASLSRLAQDSRLLIGISILSKFHLSSLIQIQPEIESRLVFVFYVYRKVMQITDLKCLRTLEFARQSYVKIVQSIFLLNFFHFGRFLVFYLI
jgi:hypothetical protein